MATLRAELTGEANSTEPVALEGRDMVRETQANPEGLRAALEAPVRSGVGALIFAVTLGAFWAGAAVAFLWGYYGVPELNALEPPLLVFAAVITFLPPFLFVACAYALTRAQAMSDATHRLIAASDRLTKTDDTASGSAQRLGRVVRRELDALSAGLDGAFGRLRALGTALEDRVAQIDDAGARASVKTDAIAQRLNDERQGIESVAESLHQAAERASETLAGRAAQLNALIEAAGAELSSAGQSLETQTSRFLEATEKAAAAPLDAAIELDRQAKQIETAADNVVGRAEFVLARQERQRGAMNELLARLKAESTTFEQTLDAQQRAIERTISRLEEESLRLDELTVKGLQRLDAAMDNAATRSSELASSFGREGDRVKESTELASAAIDLLVGSLREAAASAQALMGEATSDARRRSNDFVGEAMGSCDLLLQAAASVAEEAEKARAALAKAAEEAERHIVALPGIAAQEAERVRDTLRGETEKMLDISARTLATLQMRSAGRGSAGSSGEIPTEPSDENGMIGDGLRGLAKRITAPKKRPEEKQMGSKFKLSAVLAAAEASDPVNSLPPSTASTLGALQVALSDLASDLDAAMDETARPELWRRYLDGDRGIFARKMANAIGPETVDHITALYRDNSRFHRAVDAYLLEFETMLERARDGDRDGFLASTLLSADTGKIYLAVAYALGRLE